MATSTEPRPAVSRDELRDLGFGAVVARESRQRLLNRDGSFNVRRTGLPFASSLSLYHYLLTVTWPRFLAIIVTGYLGVNAVFAALYYACGPEALAGVPVPLGAGRLTQSFFFSVETLATIGYGHVSPRSMPAHLVMTVESLVGLLGFAVAAGFVFAKVSRPTAAIVFSRQSVIAPYGDLTAFMFRIVNGRNNQLVELEAKVLLSRRKGDSAGAREFHQLELERDRVSFFPLSWTIVHPITTASPLFGVSDEELRDSDAEFLILLTGTDETFSQTVHARSSYVAGEVVHGARFTNIIEAADSDGILKVDVSRVHAIDRVSLDRGSLDRGSLDRGSLDRVSRS